ncbi:hypothetical protein PACTADRAFT_51754 [Pachysolen tannophilus NRRL Y-2460]|uniref:Flavin reductase like domain-containing protein n=1 Tax=Pachysolen tannophilus NRRL Y-2460 TaxID=669874 RepID=A0A1E4TQM8_PACTA|nr:hypothetical protein PACTADRAFT_51754 [Pachysolen tannophilus NRRL Y-2460]
MIRNQAGTQEGHGELETKKNISHPFEADEEWNYHDTVDPNWVAGKGASDNKWSNFNKIQIDPFSEDRSSADNYKLLIGAITPRPIAFVSTINSKGNKNLAPFSYFNVVNSDPPIFVIGFTGNSNFRDTCRNIMETGECTINIISEWFVEAANFCSINSPPDVDEWKLSGLTALPSTKVKPPHVAESAFSIEGKLINSHEWKSKFDPSKISGTMCIIEGVNFHVREDLTNKDQNLLNFTKLKPVSRLGGIMYSRTVEGYELTRPNYEEEVEKKEVKDILK